MTSQKPPFPGVGFLSDRTKDVHERGAEEERTGPKAENTRAESESATIAATGSKNHTTAEPFESLGRLNTHMKTLLDAADLINSEGGQLDSDLPLPVVAVVGDQSDGKSTLLEALSDVQLPKGTGISTKCPIQLCIRTAKTEHASIQVRGKAPRVFSDISSLEVALVQEQQNVAGTGTSATPIVVEVKGPHLPNISVVDLPGINRETATIEKNLVDLIKKLITPEHTIIIVVAKATNDIAASKGFQLAQEVDPAARRTRLVITNCDGSLENKEEDIRKLFDQKDKNIFAVKCFRKKGDQTSREARMEQEARFFSNHKLFKDYPGNTGSAQLIQSLESMLCEMIQPYHEKILHYSRKKVREGDKELKERKTTEDEFKICADKCIYGIRKEIEDQVTGSDQRRHNRLYQMCLEGWTEVGTKIRKASEELQKDLLKTIRKECEAQRGREPKQLPINFPVMERIIENLIDSFKKLVEDIIERTQSSVHKELLKIVKKNLENTPLLRDMTDIRDLLTGKINAQMEQLEEEANRKVMEILEMQKVIFFNNPKIDALVRERSAQDTQGDQSAAEPAPETTSCDVLQLVQDCGNKVLESLKPGEDKTFGDSAWKVAVHESIMGILAKLIGLNPGIPQLLAVAALKFLPWWFTKSDSKDRQFNYRDDEHRLVCLSYVYIELVCDRTVDAIPMAIIHFFNHRLASDICKLIPQLNWDDMLEIKSGAHQQKLQMLEDRLRRWRDVTIRLSGLRD